MIFFCRIAQRINVIVNVKKSSTKATSPTDVVQNGLELGSGHERERHIMFALDAFNGAVIGMDKVIVRLFL